MPSCDFQTEHPSTTSLWHRPRAQAYPAAISTRRGRRAVDIFRPGKGRLERDCQRDYLVLPRYRCRCGSNRTLAVLQDRPGANQLRVVAVVAVPLQLNRPGSLIPDNVTGVGQSAGGSRKQHPYPGQVVHVLRVGEGEGERLCGSRSTIRIGRDDSRSWRWLNRYNAPTQPNVFSG